MPGLFDELFARVKAATQEEPLPPVVQEATKRLAADAPDIQKTPVKAFGALSKLLMPHAEAYVSPMGTIYANQDRLKDQDPETVADTLLHELTHVRQKNSRTPFQTLMEYFNQQGAYGQRPDEMEAFQAEADRRTRMGRAPIYGTPDFLTPTQATRGDIALHPKFTPKR